MLDGMHVPHELIDGDTMDGRTSAATQTAGSCSEGRAEHDIGAMGTDLERASGGAGTRRRFPHGQSLHLQHLECFTLSGRQAAQHVGDLRPEAGFDLLTTFGRRVAQHLACDGSPPSAAVVGDDIPRDREEPRLDRTRRLIGMAGAVQRDERVLIGILGVVYVTDAATEESGDGRADIVEEGAVGRCISGLRPRHPIGALPASIVGTSRGPHTVRPADRRGVPHTVFRARRLCRAKLSIAQSS